MKYVFVDDGYPDANDYETNYEPMTVGRSAGSGHASVCVPVAAQPAWWAAITRVLRVMGQGGRGSAGRSALRVAYES